MHVAIDAHIYGITRHGGIVRIFDELARQMAAHPDVRATYFSRIPFLCRPPEAANVQVLAFPSPAIPPATLRSRLLRRPAPFDEARFWRGSDRPRVFHTSFFTRPPPELKIPAVVHVYDLVHELLPLPDDMPDPAAFLAAKRAAILRADRLICISESTRAALLQCYPVDAARVSVVPCGYDPTFTPMDRDAARAAVRADHPVLTRPFLLYIGSRQRYKNFHRLVTAYGIWAGRRDVDLVVVGAPPTLWERMLVEDLAGGANQVHFLEAIADSQLRALYNAAECFVYPSLMEGFGIPLLEALGTGCPVCASDIPAFREVAGACATFFDPRDASSMHDAFNAALRLRQEKAAPSPDAVLARYSWAAAATRILDIHHELCA